MSGGRKGRSEDKAEAGVEQRVPNVATQVAGRRMGRRNDDDDKNNDNSCSSRGEG